jgi:flagellar protein FliS
MVNEKALNQYKHIGAKSAVEEATPHRLVQMLMAGALSQIAAANGYIDRKEVAKKGAAISQAISIIGGLQSSLDFDKGGDIAINLDRLYDYMVRRLAEANVENDAEKLKEVHGLLVEIKEAWDRLPEELEKVKTVAAVGHDSYNVS